MTHPMRGALGLKPDEFLTLELCERDIQLRYDAVMRQAAEERKRQFDREWDHITEGLVRLSGALW